MGHRVEKVDRMIMLEGPLLCASFGQQFGRASETLINSAPQRVGVGGQHPSGRLSWRGLSKVSRLGKPFRVCLSRSCREKSSLILLKVTKYLATCKTFHLVQFSTVLII